VLVIGAKTARLTGNDVVVAPDSLFSPAVQTHSLPRSYKDSPGEMSGGPEAIMADAYKVRENQLFRNAGHVILM